MMDVFSVIKKRCPLGFTVTGLGITLSKACSASFDAERELQVRNASGTDNSMITEVTSLKLFIS